MLGHNTNNTRWSIQTLINVCMTLKFLIQLVTIMSGWAACVVVSIIINVRKFSWSRMLNVAHKYTLPCKQPCWWGGGGEGGGGGGERCWWKLCYKKQCCWWGNIYLSTFMKVQCKEKPQNQNDPNVLQLLSSPEWAGCVVLHHSVESSDSEELFLILSVSWTYTLSLSVSVSLLISLCVCDSLWASDVPLEL